MFKPGFVALSDHSRLSELTKRRVGYRFVYSVKLHSFSIVPYCLDINCARYFLEKLKGYVIQNGLDKSIRMHFSGSSPLVELFTPLSHQAVSDPSIPYGKVSEV